MAPQRVAERLGRLHALVLWRKAAFPKRAEHQIRVGFGVLDDDHAQRVIGHGRASRFQSWRFPAGGNGRGGTRCRTPPAHGRFAVASPPPHPYPKGTPFPFSAIPRDAATPSSRAPPP